MKIFPVRTIHPNLSLTLGIILIFTLVRSSISTSWSQTDGQETLVHQFADGSSIKDGTSPYGALVQGTDGSFYGTTLYGGTTATSDTLGFGTVFKLTPSGVMSVLHNFNDGSIANDGQFPSQSLTLGTDGNFYGITTEGGSGGFGTVFKLSPAGVVTIVQSFHEGKYPNAALIAGPDGNLYGTTSGGGQGYGTVFKLTPAGQITTLHQFGDQGPEDGQLPYSPLTLGSDGNFYGTTFRGGKSDLGTVYQITPAGKLTILHSFGAPDASGGAQYPYSGVIWGRDGNLYGTTSSGGAAGAGVAFCLTPGGALTLLHSFNDGSVINDGQDPNTGLIQGSDGNLYGTTSAGGTAGAGVVFKLTPAGVYTLLHSFSDGSVPNDGKSPQASLLLGNDGGLYGTTFAGGASGSGSVFKIFVSGLIPPNLPTVSPAPNASSIPQSPVTTGSTTPANPAPATPVAPVAPTIQQTPAPPSNPSSDSAPSPAPAPESGSPSGVTP